MEEHISYEYTMMSEMHRIKDGGQLQMDVFNNMWNIVAFTTAQNLIWSQLFDRVKIPNDILEILDKVDDQIMSLTSRRTSDTSEKLQLEDFLVLKNFIDQHKDKLNIPE